jgi:hypothetical protein
MSASILSFSVAAVATLLAGAVSVVARGKGPSPVQRDPIHQSV